MIILVYKVYSIFVRTLTIPYFLHRTDSAKWVQTNVPDSCCAEMTDDCGHDYDANDVNINHEVLLILGTLNY